MNPNRLSRHRSYLGDALRVLGVTDATSADPFHRGMFRVPLLLHTQPGGEGGGEGGGGGGGEGGKGKDSGGGNDDGDDDGDGSGKSLAEMNDAEKAAYWKKMARQNERRAKAAPPAEELEKLRASAAELEKIRDAERTDTEKAVKRAETAEAELAKTTPRLLRLEVALDKGLTAKQAARLVGATREELETDADELLADLGLSAKDREREAKDTKRTARRSQDGGPRGSASDTKATVATGSDLYANRRGKKTTATT